MKKHSKIAIILPALVLIAFIAALSPLDIKRVHAAGSLSGKTSVEIVSQMGMGWNLGNTFDATGGNTNDIYSQETSWGNPKVTQELIQAVHDRGFKTIRIPVTWSKFIDKNNGYTIRPEFLARVKEVVDYAYNLDMFIILNLHHESWVNVSTLDTTYEKVGEELEAVWKQIADYFADYDQHLIFEGMNEPRMAGSSVEWTGNQAAYKAVNYLDQIFAYTVRSSHKGHNDERCLMIPGYAASSSQDILKGISIPSFEGNAVKNIIISVHCYSPYDFCLSDAQMDFDPNNKNHTSAIDSLFKTLEETFLFNDIPVVIGETSASNKDNTDQRENWAYYMGNKSAKYGIPIVIWDNGANGHSGGECHAWINRRHLEWNYPTVVDKLFSGYNSVKLGSATSEDKKALESSTQDTGIIGGRIIWEKKSGHTVAGETMSHAQPIRLPVIKSYLSSSNEICIAYSGNTAPLIILENENDGINTSAIEPYKTEIKADKQIAHYKYRTINDALESSGIGNPSKVSHMTIVSGGPDIKIFEIATLYLNATVSYSAGGQTFNSEASVTTLPGLYVLGWYTTRDYQEGTEFTGTSGKDITVYGKLCWEKDAKAMTIVEKNSSVQKPTVEPTPADSDKSEDTASPDTSKNQDSSDKQASSDTSDTDNSSKSNDQKDESKSDDTSKPAGDDDTDSSSASDSGKDNKESKNSFVPVLLIIILLIAALCSGLAAFLLIKKKKQQ